jgi:hypothetical protein
MLPTRAIPIALMLLVSLPAFGERLLFEGSFDTRTPCHKAEGCREPMAIEPMFISFTVDVNDVSFERRTTSADWAPPQLSPALLTQSTFESLTGRRVDSVELQRLFVQPSSWTWEASTGRQWRGASSDDPQAVHWTYFESRGLGITAPRSGNAAVTFADLVATFDAYLAAGTPIAISQHAGFDVVSSEFTPLDAQSEILTGTVRIKSITCRAPSRTVGALWAGAVRSLRGSS